MACRKNSPGKPCCDVTGCVFDRDDLPEEFIFEGSTIYKAEWQQVDTSPGGIGCCWVATIPYPVNSSRWEFYCSTEATISIGGDTYATKLVAYRLLKYINIGISRSTMVCDGNPSALQYHVAINKFYGGQYGNQYYYPPSPSCRSLVFSMAFSLLPGTRYDYYVRRSKAFATIPTGTYTLEDGDLAACTPDPICLNYSGLTSVTIENTSTGQSIVFDDSADWTFDTIF